MGVTTTNFIQGPATLYDGAYGAAEPADGRQRHPRRLGVDGPWRHRRRREAGRRSEVVRADLRPDR